MRAGGAAPEDTEGTLVIVMGGSTCWAEVHELWGLRDQSCDGRPVA